MRVVRRSTRGGHPAPGRGRQGRPKGLIRIGFLGKEPARWDDSLWRPAHCKKPTRVSYVVGDTNPFSTAHTAI